jgi:hypothetical protein
MVSLRVIYTDDTYCRKIVKTFWTFFLKIFRGVSESRSTAMEADGIGPALVRSLTSRALTRHALVRSCRDRATRPQNAKKLFRQFCAGK